jgi:transposase
MKKDLSNLNLFTADDLKKMTKEELIESLIKERSDRIDLINELKKPKVNSTNSSSPPSQDTVSDRQKRHKKQKSHKKTGGQIGHNGKTLKFQAPTNVINLYRYTPDAVVDKLISSCQIIDIKFEKIVTEYRLFTTNRKNSDTINTVLPTNFTSYASSIKAIITYLSVEQAISEERIVRLFNDVFQIQLSSGLISRTLAQANLEFDFVHKLLKKQVNEALVLVSDETFMNLSGNQVYLWNWNSKDHSYFTASLDRSYQNVQENLPNFKGILVTDRLPTQLKLKCDHQICTVHLQRDLKKLPISEFRTKLENLIGEAQITPPGITNHQFFTEELAKLINTPPPNDKLSIAMYFSINKLRNSVFKFLTNPEIPHHNNTTERELRKSKIKHKITGGFRTLKGFETYAKILSFIQTCRKQGQNVWQEILALYQGKPLALKFEC